MSYAASIRASLLDGIHAVPVAHADDPAHTGAANIAALTRQLVAGDQASFREFHALYFDRLYGFLLVVTQGDVHAAQDALQETMLRVARRAREFDDPEIFWGWLKAVARNAARDGRRKQRRYLAVLEKFAFWRRETPPVRDLDSDVLRSLLDEGLAELGLDDRGLVEGKYLRGLTVLELARDSGLTEKAVESRLLRARRQLGATILRRLRKP